MKKMVQKLFNICLILAITCTTFMPAFSIEAATPYTVEMVSNTTNNKVIGSYSTYSEAVKVMNAQNSTSTSVATVYKNGVVVNSKYAIFRLKPNTKTVYLYQNSGDSTAYTYTSPSYMTDTAFLDSNEKRANIMLNGFRGWIDLSAGDIIPISLLQTNMISINASGLNVRADASTNSTSIGAITCNGCLYSYTAKKSNQGYTWYQITYNDRTGWVADGDWLVETTGNGLNTYYYRYSTGNLLHRYAYHNGTSYTDSFTNLGPTPSYLQEDVRYYSFDGGIYLYTSLTSMLDDYKNNTNTHSLNVNNPNYPYYLYLPNKSKSNITAEQIDSQITDPSSKLYGQGKYFKEAEELYGMNALSAFSTAKNESASGTSQIAKDKNNVFGYGASDSCPYDCAKSYNSVRDSIMEYAQKGNSNYMTAQAIYYFGTHAGTKGSGRNVKYASDPLWGEKQASNAFTTDKNAGMRDYLANTIGVTAFGKYNVAVYEEASTNKVIYRMQNSNSNFKVYNVPVTVLEKVGDFYKIYADSSSYKYGYVKTSDLYVANKAPEITASDQTIALNSNFNYMAGVSANDAENGNLTSRITYSGKVNTAKAGTYKVTYKVTDNSNFTTSKTVNITVKGASEPVINATDKEVSQYTEFNYMDGVTAHDDTDGDITKNITYSGLVNTEEKGDYKVTYSVTNSNNKTTTKTINVTVVDNEKPVINAQNKTIYLNSTFDPKEGVTATDKEDGNLTNSLEVTKNEVKTDTIGDYKVVYKVTDKAGQTTTKEITVSVTEKVLQKADGEFYLDGIKWNDDSGKYEISGYLIQLNADNGANDKLKYQLILENSRTGERYSLDVARWLTDIPYDLGEENGHDYRGAWFKGDIDLNTVPEGDYNLYMRSESDNYYTEVLFSNIMNSPIDKRHEDSEKGYSFFVNLNAKNKKIELSVRDDGLITTNESPTYRNMVNDYDDMFFVDDYLYVSGTSYNYGIDYSDSSIISRKIYLENLDTFDRISADINNSEEGSYEVTSLDNLSKKYAWYDGKIDVSKLEKGTYAIIIDTTVGSNEDYGCVSDMFNAINDASVVIDGKNYKLVVNTEKNNRIELVIS